MSLSFFEGQEALPVFRLESLKAALSKALPNVAFERLSAKFVYLLESNTALDTAAQERAATLLDAKNHSSFIIHHFSSPRDVAQSPRGHRARQTFSRNSASPKSHASNAR